MWKDGQGCNKNEEKGKRNQRQLIEKYISFWQVIFFQLSESKNWLQVAWQCKGRMFLQHFCVKQLVQHWAMGAEYMQYSSTACRRIIFSRQSPLLQWLTNFQVFKVYLGQEVTPELSLMLSARCVQLFVSQRWRGSQPFSLSYAKSSGFPGNLGSWAKPPLMGSQIYQITHSSTFQKNHWIRDREDNALVTWDTKSWTDLKMQWSSKLHK